MNDDLNFLDIFYPQILVCFTRNWTLSTPSLLRTPPGYLRGR